MYQSPYESSSYSKYAYYSVDSAPLPPPLPTNPNPNPNPSDFHSLSSSAYDPYPISGSYPKSDYYSDPNPASSSWVVKQAAPVRYSSPVAPSQPLNREPIAYEYQAVQPLNREPIAYEYQGVPPLNKENIASTSYGASLNSNWGGTKFVKNGSNRKPKQPKTNVKKPSSSHNMRCELCKIECNNVQIYEKHLSGKKHSKNLLKAYAPSTTPSVAQASQLSKKKRKSSEMVTPCGQGKPGVPSASTNLETKKQKLLEGGAAVQSLKLCTICNVACNGEVAFADHLAGKKHAAQERARGTVAKPNPGSVTNPKPKPKPQENPPKKTKEGENLVWCEVCKISCTSADGLETHKQGKKHKKNLEKLQTPKTTSFALPASTAAPENAEATTKAATTTVSEPQNVTKKKKKARSKEDEPEDVEAKKQKILKSGGTTDAVRTCTICNVVCNSETVFNSHLAGQKHAAMVKQQSESAAGKAAEAEQQVDEAGKAEQKEANEAGKAGGEGGETAKAEQGEAGKAAADNQHGVSDPKSS